MNFLILYLHIRIDMTNHFIIGVTGGSGSGKTTIIKELKQRFDKKELCIVSQDDYYKQRSEQKRDENGVKNFDLPESIELDELNNDLKNLREGMTVHRKEYTFNNAEKDPVMKTFQSAPIIIVEGLFVFTHPEIRKTFDLNVFIDAKDSIKIIRRIKRDKIERNYPLDDVIYRYQHHVQPAFEKYVLPFKSRADIIINNNEDYSRGLRVLIGFINDHLLKITSMTKG